MSTQEGSVKITLPDGEVREYPFAIWQEMLENVQQQCDDHFENGPTNLKEAYSSLLTIGLGQSQKVESSAKSRSSSSSGKQSA